MNRGAKLLSRFFQSQTEVAGELGIGPSMLSLLLSGDRMPSIETAVAIKRKFGVPCEAWIEAVPSTDGYRVLSEEQRARINTELSEECERSESAIAEDAVDPHDEPTRD